MIELTDEELNHLCATEIMAWHWERGTHLYYDNDNRVGFSDGPDGYSLWDEPIWSPLTDPFHNEMLLDRMVELGKRIGTQYFKNCWSVNIDLEIIVNDPDRKRAIVTACLKAVGAI